MYRGDGRGRGGTRGGSPRGAMGGNFRGGRGRGGPFSSWTPSAYDNRPEKSSMGSSLDWANSAARAKMLGGNDEYGADTGEDYYKDAYGGYSSAPGPADYHSGYNHPEYVSYPLSTKAKPLIRGLFDAPTPRGGGSPQVGKRPPPSASVVQQSPTGRANAKRVRLSSMSDLLESSQRDMSALSSQGNSELSKVLEKQQRLLEMQSKLIAEMTIGTNGNNSNGVKAATVKTEVPMETVESEAPPASVPGRGAHQRGGSVQRGGSATRRGRGHKSLWETLGSEGRGRPVPTEDPYGFPAAGRGARGRGESGLRGRGSGELSRGRGEGSLARGRGDGLLSRGRGDGLLSRGRGRDAGLFGRERELEDPEYGSARGYEEPYAYGKTRGRGALRGVRGRGESAYGRGALASRPGVPRRVSTYGQEVDPYAEDPYAADPYADAYADPYADDPYAEDPYARDPYARDPYARDPYARDPYARDPYAADPYARDAYARDPYAEDPYAEDPYGEDPYARDPYAVDPYRAEAGYARPVGRGKPLAHQRRDPNLPLYDGQSVETRMQTYIGYLFGFRKLFLPISAIETTRHEHVDDVKVRTQYATFEDDRKTPSTFGIMRVNGVILAVEQTNQNNEVKDITYKKALYNLFTMSVSEMLANSNKIRQTIPKNVQEEHHLKSAPSKVIGNRLQFIVDQIRDELYDNQVRGIQPKLIHEVDVACGNAQAGITLVYRNTHEGKMVTAELYADDLMLASSAAYKKMTAYHFVYRDAKKYLMNHEISSLDIVRENKRLQELNMMADDILEIQFKGKNHEKGTNMWILKAKYPNTWKRDIKEKGNLVVMKHTYDRASIPYKVLEDLANMNHMLLNFANYGDNDQGPFRCVIFLQGELVGDGDGYTKGEAKDNAARKALMTFTENNSVIQVGKRKYNNPDYNFAAVKEAAEKLQSENPTMFKDWKASLHPQPAGEDPPLDDLTPYVDKVLEDLIQDYICTQGLEEIILDRDFPACFITMMLQACKDLDVDIEKKDGDDFQDRTRRTVIQKSVIRNGHPSEIVKILREMDGQSGRYTLTQWIDENGQLVKKRV